MRNHFGKLRNLRARFGDREFGDGGPFGGGRHGGFGRKHGRGGRRGRRGNFSADELRICSCT